MISFMKYISVIARCSAQYRNYRLSDAAITGNQYAFILNICRNPGISQDGLATLVHLNKSNVARQLAQLESNGYIERTYCPCDKRITEVYPTDKAESVMPEIQTVLREWNEYLTEGFSDEERLLVSRILEKMTERAADYVDSGCGELPCRQAPDGETK